MPIWSTHRRIWSTFGAQLAHFSTFSPHLHIRTAPKHHICSKHSCIAKLPKCKLHKSLHIISPYFILAHICAVCTLWQTSMTRVLNRLVGTLTELGVARWGLSCYFTGRFSCQVACTWCALPNADAWVASNMHSPPLHQSQRCTVGWPPAWIELGKVAWIGGLSWRWCQVKYC